MTREDNDAGVSDMAAVVTRSDSPISAQEWDELYIPEGYRAEVIQSHLVVYPTPDWQVSGEAPPITLDEWQPDVIVTPVGIDELRVAPLFGVEVLSPTGRSPTSSCPRSCSPGRPVPTICRVGGPHN